MLEFYLITRNPEMATRAKQTKVVQAERLNDRTSYNEDDAIVRSAYEMKMQKSAEMTDSYQNIDRVTCGYYNETEVIPGVIVKAIPTQAGLLPLVPEPFIPILQAPSSKKQYEMFILSEEFINKSVSFHSDMETRISSNWLGSCDANKAEGYDVN